MSRFVYQLAPPPRAVPLLLRGQVLVGSFISLFGWVFFGFGLIFVWAFGIPSVLSSLWLDRLPLRSAEGVVSEVRETGASENERRVYAYHFHFTGQDGETHAGVSYVTGAADVVQAGDKVTVQYPEGHPEKARIEGMRANTFGAFVLFVLIFPAVGFFMLIPGLLQGIRANRLLANGKPATGTLTSKEPTNGRVNNRPIYRLTFRYRADDGREYDAVAKTADPERLEDESEESLLFDPENPSRAVMLDSLPGSPAIDVTGNLQPAGSLKSLLVLAVPVVILLGHGTYVYYAFIR